jgi:F-type H+-transporting ATPase subunit epsilon
MPLHVEVVTQTGAIYANDADEVVAPGSEGQLGILPRHAPLMTTLKIGALRVKHGGNEETIFIGGGFMEVFNDEVTILADDAERAANIDEAAAEEARRRAQTLLEQQTGDTDVAFLQGQIERAIGRLRVAEVHRQHRRRPELPTQS